MLPDIDGFQICQIIREKFYFPVIMLTANVEDGDKIMGLAIAKEIVELHHGRITAHSANDLTCFEVSLPLVRKS